MSDSFSDEQIKAYDQLSVEDRYADFIDNMVQGNAVWSLSSDTGWAIISDGDDEFLPVWPRAELAATWATDGYADCTPKAIELSDWLEKWLPGMSKDELQVAVCPDTLGEGIVISAEELLSDIEKALQ